MASTAIKSWRIPKIGEPQYDVPLWYALGEFRVAVAQAKTIDEALLMNREIIKRDKRARKLGIKFFDDAAQFATQILQLVFQKVPLARRLTSFLDGLVRWISSGITWLGFFLSIGIVSLLLLKPDLDAPPFGILALCATVLVWISPSLVRQLLQYGFGFPARPLQSRVPEDDVYDQFLDYFQSAEGPKAYILYRSLFSKKLEGLDRRQFFGNLRYFLCSENDADRRLVIPYKSIRFRSSDIYVHRDDLNRIIEESVTEPEPEAGPRNRKGVDSKYPYEDAIVGVLSGNKLKALSLDDPKAANLAIRKELVAWFEQQAGKDDETPRIDYPRIEQCAEKIFAILQNFSDN